MPLIKLEWNDFNQPVGPGSKDIPHVLSSLIRTKHFPLNHPDWRDVDVSHKEKLVERIGCVYEMDDCLEEYIYTNSKKKWKDFKHDLKMARFDSKLTYKENLAICDPRVDKGHWKWLVEHWMSEESQASSARNKENRPKVVSPNYTGAKTIARATHECEKELGRKLRRDEIYVRTHTPKTGAPKEETQAKFIMPTTTSGLTSAVQRVSQEGGGKEVILLSTERPRDQAVAKATVQTIDPEARVGGCVLGTDCYEVVVNTLIMRGDHLLPRQYGKVKTLADSVGRSIAWPHMNIMVEESAPGNSRIQ